MGDSISKTLGPPSPLFPDPNPLLLAEESGGAQPNQQVTVILEKTVALLGLVEKRDFIYFPFLFSLQPSGEHHSHATRIHNFAMPPSPLCTRSPFRFFNRFSSHAVD